MIKAKHVKGDDGPRIEIEIENRGGKVTASLTPASALHFRGLLDRALVSVLKDALDENAVEEAFS